MVRRREGHVGVAVLVGHDRDHRTPLGVVDPQAGTGPSAGHGEGLDPRDDLHRRRRHVVLSLPRLAVVCQGPDCEPKWGPSTESGSKWAAMAGQIAAPGGDTPMPTSVHTTLVTLTGTGIPHPTPGRAGPGVLVRRGHLALLFDAGRGTVLRLAEAGCEPWALTRAFVTHVHSDHLVDLADVAMTRWLQQLLHPCGPLAVTAADGVTARFVQHMLDPYRDDIAVRMAHVGSTFPEVDLHTFAVTPVAHPVWQDDAGMVRVDAVAVHHEPVEDAVAYRVTTPEGVVVISGDTRVCDEVEDLARGADVLVHEACRTTVLAEAMAGTVLETVFSYHADTVALGALAERAGVGHLVLTHLIPSPTTDAEATAFEADVRAGGYTGRVTVGRDHDTVALGHAGHTVALGHAGHTVALGQDAPPP